MKFSNNSSINSLFETIVDLSHDLYTVKVTKEMGRGLFAERNISQGEIITNCEILELSAIDTMIVNSTELKYYTFKLNDSQDCLVLGHGEIFNHADKANVSYKLVKVDNRMVMQFKSLSPILKGEQLFINYNADTKVNVLDYVNNESLIKVS